ncbi:Protein of unknown function [Gryllus bimaculatus]|nr:Protein of unknown function [Gryllus bimaculatus]
MAARRGNARLLLLKRLRKHSRRSRNAIDSRRVVAPNRAGKDWRGSEGDRGRGETTRQGEQREVRGTVGGWVAEHTNNLKDHFCHSLHKVNGEGQFTLKKL